ncbi:NAD(P)/FAD-dependent oxidoreductase [Mesorhizobium shangrilense]|uniref:FAD-dependent oxidoreductase n=1 Tax=Mesorhizobium shangrilense TaxID=460060 RepID=A0ABV2DGH8_9HYPH
MAFRGTRIARRRYQPCSTSTSSTTNCSQPTSTLSIRCGIRFHARALGHLHTHGAQARLPQALPSRPPSRQAVVDVAASALYCPMTQGLRLTTGAEIARFPLVKTPRQLVRAERMAREAIDFGEAVEPEPWAGWRPCMPDMLPVVGAVPEKPGLWCNFGHGHQGFTLGPSSARLFLVLVHGRAEDKLSQAVSPGRYL